MQKAEWQRFGVILKDLFKLEYSPVALTCQRQSAVGSSDKKMRICKALLDAGKGEMLQIDKRNNACFGASWHLGFHAIKDPRIKGMVRKFVVEGEKLFCSYEALDNLIAAMGEPPDNSENAFLLAPLEKAEHEPDLVIFISNADAACRILTLATFLEGRMPRIQIGGPTCRMSIIYPLTASELNVSFYDYTARKLCNVEKDKLLISIPFKDIPRIIESIERCSGGTARIEFPEEFRDFLRQRLTVNQA